MTPSNPKKVKELLSKQERMAKALRENLYKRKQQQRERADQDKVDLSKKTIDENN